MLPRSIPRPDTPVPTSAAAADRLRSDRPGPRAFLRSAMPALDRAFGLEHIAAVPDDIADLIGRLQAGPLGHPGAGQASISERASILERAALPEPAEAVS